jgi:DNA-directed RNA polymerase sigma subunit (sigma70/sigma32)
MGTSPVINLNLKEQMASVLKMLTPREEKIIKMRFGMEDGSEHNPKRSHKLRAFLEHE